MLGLLETAIFFLAIFVIFVSYQRSKNPRPIFNVYQRPNGLYWLKVAFMYTILSLRKIQNKRTNLNSLEHYAKLDQPQELSSHEKAIDAVYMNGANKSGDHLVVGTARRKNNLIDGFMYLKIADSNLGVLESLKLPGTSLYQVEESEFNQYAAEGIRLTAIEPMKKWKLTFSGIMKEFNNRDKLHYVRIDAEFTSDLPYFNFDTDMDPLTMAKSMAYEKFSREYFKSLEANHQTHYEQFGDLKGVASIDGKEFKINLDTMRDHSFGTFREWSNFWRYGLHFLTTENGDRFSLGKICMPVSLSRLTIGYVYVAAEKKMYPVRNIDFELFQHGENGTPPLDYGFNFLAGDKTYSMQVKVVDTPHFYISKNWESRVVERLCKFSVNGVSGWGAAEWQYRNIQGKDVPDFDKNFE